jgi:hypothetical protein
MHSATLLRLFASLCLLVLLALPGCMKGSPGTRPGGGGDFSTAQADAPGPMATRGDFGGYRQAAKSEKAKGAPNTYPSGGGGGASAVDSPGPMGTRADYGGYASKTQAEPAAEAYGGDGGAYHQPHDFDDSSVAAAPTLRPGLGTSYGEQHFSQVTTAPFVRGSSQPDVLLSLWYNDADGIQQAQGGWGRGLDQTSQTSTSDGAFVVSLVDEHGYGISAAQVGDKRYVVGQPGQRYKLTVQNNSPHRYEVVASVDGLDVIDGDTASFVKRGYILDPWGSITIDGWRTGNESIAAFRFSGMEDSYADRKGDGRNIGVVGFAFFHERGGVPWQELQRRDNADPFPHRYAEPPPPRRVH